MDKKRYLNKNITTDLAEKMVFLAGPRQVGVIGHFKTGH